MNYEAESSSRLPYWAPRPPDNPAARLRQILLKILYARDTTWADLFGVPEDEEETTDRLARRRFLLVLDELTEQIRVAIESLPEEEDPSHLLHEYTEVETFVWSIGAAWQKPIEKLKVSRDKKKLILYVLDGCSRKLARHQPEPGLTEEDLHRLQHQVRDLVDEVIRLRLPERAKRLLLQRLREVEVALQEFLLVGYSGIEIALDHLEGTINRVESLQRSGIGQRVRRFWDALVLASQGTQAITGAATQAATLVKAIGGDGTSGTPTP